MTRVGVHDGNASSLASSPAHCAAPSVTDATSLSQVGSVAHCHPRPAARGVASKCPACRPFTVWTQRAATGKAEEGHTREHPPSTGLSRVPHRCALAWPSEPFTSHSGPWHQCAALSRGSLCSCDAVLSLTEARPKPPSWRSPFQRQLVPPHVSVLPTEAAPWTGPALWCLCSACTSCCPPLNLLTLTFYSPFRGWLTPCLSHEDFPGVVCTSTTGLYMSLYTRPLMFEKNTDKAPRSPQTCTSC